METLGYLIIGALSHFAQKFMASSIGGTLIDNLLDSAFGGAVEELVEGFIHKKFPRAIFVRAKKKKRMKELASEVKNELKKLSNEELKELLTFITSKKMTELLGKKCGKELGKLTAVDAKDEKAVKDLISELLDKIGDVQTGTLAYKSDM